MLARIENAAWAMAFPVVETDFVVTAQSGGCLACIAIARLFAWDYRCRPLHTRKDGAFALETIARASFEGRTT